jgi:hypothetical protein
MVLSAPGGLMRGHMYTIADADDYDDDCLTKSGHAGRQHQTVVVNGWMRLRVARSPEAGTIAIPLCVAAKCHLALIGQCKFVPVVLLLFYATTTKKTHIVSSERQPTCDCWSLLCFMFSSSRPPSSPRQPKCMCVCCGEYGRLQIKCCSSFVCGHVECCYLTLFGRMMMPQYMQWHSSLWVELR